MSKVLVTGSQSYIGSVLTPYLIRNGYEAIGIDAGFIKDCLLYPSNDGKTIYKDVRDISKKDLKNIDAVIHLAGISNDPFKNFNPVKVYQPVRNYTLKIAELCKASGIKFIFPSSCSVYGKSIEGYLNEESAVFPQTPYSVNKLQIEQDLIALSDKDFIPIIFRFATVFGLSPRIRFDLVVNMFTAMAYTMGKIVLNSNGMAWRPNVHVDDVCQAIKLALDFKPSNRLPIILNGGDTSLNFQILDLAKMVAKEVPGCKVSFINNSDFNANIELIKDRKIQDGVDSRNYKISFEKIKSKFPGFKCNWTVKKGIKSMLKKFREIDLKKEQFENIDFYRLQKLEWLIKNGFISQDLHWIKNHK